MDPSIRLVRQALKHPDKIPEYVRGKLFPNSPYGKSWARTSEGDITWGDFWWGNESPPEISATDYYAFRTFRSYLGDETFEAALEVGCGYGRQTAWISEFAESTTGLDANREVIDIARGSYPHIDFCHGRAQSLPFPRNEFDLVVCWTVLQHVPDTEIEAVAREISRVLRDDGRLLLLEDTNVAAEKAASGLSIWPRSVRRYQSLFEDRALADADYREFPEESSLGNRDLQLLRFEGSVQ